ncbi:MAG TPA: tRNA (adenosine(37)-N6)-dimethylallyltransferase MiaA [Burkholderiales bacterium]|nr:tRNA (adenosine(37)-N6)-dimethylallyltransferase MiaA [Burkholderiales bacterium]
MGPTASGKSALAMELAAALNAEIISVDSAQVYRDMDVGTAKPSAAERAAVPHHLIDILAPDEAYSAARFRGDALAACAQVTERGRLPLLAGGTMLYFKALREGLSTLPVAHPAMRAAIDAEAARRGWPALHAELAEVDPESAARLQPTDAQRIQRALEVYRSTGIPLSRHFARREAGGETAFHFIPVAIEPSQRAVLHQRIEERFDAMLAAGLVEELRALRLRYRLGPQLPSMRSVGYRQAWEHLEGRIGAAELRAQGIYATRQLAKRQLTWLRSMQNVARFDCLDAELAPRVLAHLRQALRNPVPVAGAVPQDAP